MSLRSRAAPTTHTVASDGSRCTSPEVDAYGGNMTALPAPHSFTNSTATGSAYDHGAHVTAWTPAGAAPVLWMSAASNLDDTAPIRGGVPICFPWFGAGRSQDLTPAHGYARIRPWHLVDIRNDGDATTAVWELRSRGEDAERFHVTYTVTFGRQLHLSYSVTNLGDTTASFEEALHTYLAVGDIARVHIEGLEGCTYLDKVAGAGQRQDGPVTFTAETDRIYSTQGAVTLVDPVLQRRIVVERTGSANVVVWNPWVAKAAAMPDFGDDEWPGMVCIEAANALVDAVTLEPGASHTMTCTLTVEAL